MDTKGHRKIETGVVIRCKQDKTAVVAIEKIQVHPIYKKRIRRMKNVQVHDEKNETRVGDTVSIIETRPLSKTKRWRVKEVLAHSQVSQEK
jgi:small subunit ribosomal protein S17